MRIKSNKNITYELIQSDLPDYIKLINKGSLTLTGVVQLVDERAPVWVSESGTLASLTELEENVEIQITANVGSSGLPIAYTIAPSFDKTGGSLPFGLTLDKETGLISGEVVRNLVDRSNPIPFFDEERPTWVTEDQQWALASKDDFTVTLEATPAIESPVSYSLSGGGLPFGLTLDKETGIISGTLVTVLALGEKTIPEVEPKPRWNTPPGRISIKNEKETYEYQLKATPINGVEIQYHLVKGGLPFGVTLDKNTGLLTGDTAEVYYPELPELIDTNGPVLLSKQNLGKYKHGDTVDVTLISSAYKEREIVMYAMYPDVKSNVALPFGLYFSKEGRIHGVLDASSPVGLYQFTIVVYDTVGLRSCNVFRMTVEEQEVIGE